MLEGKHIKNNRVFEKKSMSRAKCLALRYVFEFN